MSSDWSSGSGGVRSEPGLDSLCEWLDGAARRSRDTPWGTWGGWVGGSLGPAGGATGALAGTHQPWFLYLIPWGIWLTGALIATGWLVRALRAASAAEFGARDQRKEIARLWYARYQGRLRSTLGNEQANYLNEAAKLVLRCRTLMDSPAWRQASISGSWSSVAANVRDSMDAGMVRLLTLTTQGGASSEVDETIGEMRSLVAEVADTEKRHAATFGKQTGRPDALRSTLEQLRELSRAEEEALSELRISC